jgi:hypothetical protein
MSDPFEDDSMNPPHYKFVTGRGDSDHETRINKLADKRYRAALMVYDPNGYADNVQLVVLMERKI